MAPVVVAAVEVRVSLERIVPAVTVVQFVHGGTVSTLIVFAEALVIERFTVAAFAKAAPETESAVATSRSFNRSSY